MACNRTTVKISAYNDSDISINCVHYPVLIVFVKSMIFVVFKDFWVSYLWLTVLRMIFAETFGILDSFSFFESYEIW